MASLRQAHVRSVAFAVMEIDRGCDIHPDPESTVSSRKLLYEFLLLPLSDVALALLGRGGREGSHRWLCPRKTVCIWKLGHL